MREVSDNLQDQYSSLMESQQSLGKSAPNGRLNIAQMPLNEEWEQLERKKNMKSPIFSALIMVNQGPLREKMKIEYKNIKNLIFRDSFEKGVCLPCELEFVGQHRLRISSSSYFELPCPVKIDFYIMEYVEVEDHGQMLKVIAILSSGKEIKIFLSLSCQQVFIYHLRILGARYHFRLQSIEQQNELLHNAYKSIAPLNAERKYFKKYAGICTYNGNSGYLVVGHPDKLLIIHEGQVIRELQGEEDFQDHGYWMEFDDFWIGFRDRGKKKTFQMEFKTRMAQLNNQNRSQWLTEVKSMKSITPVKQKCTETTVLKSQMPKPNMNFDLMQSQEKTVNRKLNFQDTISPEKKVSGQLSSKNETSLQIQPGKIRQIQQLRLIKDVLQMSPSLIENFQTFDDKNKIIEQKTMNIRLDNSNTIVNIAEMEDEGFKIRDQQQECYYKQNQSSFANKAFMKETSFQRSLINQRKEANRPLFGDLTEQFQIDQMDIEQISQNYHHENEQSSSNSKYSANRIMRELEQRQNYFNQHSSLNSMPVFELKDVLQVFPTIVASLGQNNSFTLHRRALNSLNFERSEIQQNMKPVKLFSSRAERSFYFLEENNKGIYNYDLTKQRSVSILCNLKYFQTFKDVKFISQHTFGILTKSVIKIIDIRQGKIKKQNFKGYLTHNHDFKVMDIAGSKVAVGREDGIVKIYDTRNLNKVSLNNFDLKGQQRYSDMKNGNNLFKKIEIMPRNNDIFCSFNNSAYIIQTHSNKNNRISAFDKTIPIENRIAPKRYPESLQNGQKRVESKFSITKNGSKIVQLLQDGSQKYIDLIEDNVQTKKSSEGSVYLEYDEHSKNSLIRGTVINGQLRFSYEPQN